MALPTKLSYDVVVVGGGPAGLSAALVLGRCRRSVLVVDAGSPRNIASHALHGFVTRDGTPPSEFLRMCREDVTAYGVEVCPGQVRTVSGSDGSFQTHLDGGAQVITSRKILLATGVVDHVPSLAGIENFYGKTVHHCPYCDAWEHRDQRIAVYGQGKPAALLAIKLKVWTADVMLCTGGPSRIPEAQRQRLARHGIQVHQQPVERLEGVSHRLSGIAFRDGSSVQCSALFFGTGHAQRSDLIRTLGIVTSGKGKVKISRGQRCSVSGVFVCGDAAEDSQYVVVAAAHGARAAMAINTDLFEADFA